MSLSHVLVPLLGGLVAMTVLSVSAARAAGDPRLRASLEALTSRTIFFGHQSVGGNILEGMRELAAEEGVPLRVLEVKDATGLAPGALCHAAIGQNGAPASKLRAFEQALQGAPGGRPVIALMKLCYLDFDRGTDVPAIFASYQASLTALQARHPGTTFVHLTAPLQAAEGSLKELARRILGKETRASGNARRERFNDLVRQAYRGREPLFDLALLEATGPGGGVETSDWEGARVRVLAAAYTDDGGHLNAAGRRHVARELVTFLAALPVAAPGASTGGGR